MSEHLQKRTLLVVSDTAMFKSGNELLVFDPVLRELNAIEDMFDEIIWLGARSITKKKSLKPINSSKIKVIVLPCISKHGVLNILNVMTAYPVVFYYIMKYIGKATHVHTRAPSHPAWLMILLSLFDGKRIYAHKYAGEWTDKNIPFTYRAQRSILKRVRKRNLKVVISGKNEEESANVHDMENPCIYEQELDAMHSAGSTKNFSGSLKLLFVGNLMPTKGIIELLNALQDSTLCDRYTELTIVGGGALMSKVQELTDSSERLTINILGDISREDLNQQYAQVHILILPSSSESFPKVVAEAAAYGCIPVTTSLSAITKKVVDGKNGFLMGDNQPQNILNTLNRVAGSEDLRSVSKAAMQMSDLFTYERFKERMARIYEMND